MTPLRDWPPKITNKFRIGDKADCWEWIAGHSGNGYGRVMLRDSNGRRQVQAHRLLYEMFVGPIPEGLVLDHLCRNPPCVNPHHLEPVTHRENMARGIKGRLTVACPRGHAYDENNSKHECRLCLKERRATPTYRQRHAAEERARRARVREAQCSR